MTLRGLIFRYLLTYVALLVVLGHLLELAGLHANFGLFVVLLIGASYWPCLLYGKRNGHFLDKRETRQVVVGLTLIDLSFQILFGNLPLPGSAPWPYIATRFLLLLGVHGAIIALVVRLAGRRLSRLGIGPPSRQPA